MGYLHLHKISKNATPPLGVSQRGEARGHRDKIATVNSIAHSPALGPQELRKEGSFCTLGPAPRNCWAESKAVALMVHNLEQVESAGAG